MTDVNVWKWLTGTKNRRELDTLHKARFVDRQIDPETGLQIYKYSRGFTVKAFSNPWMWTPLMLSMRGAVYDRYGHKVNGNMNKFFNHNEPNAATLSFDSLVLDKLDGSCVQVFLYDGEPVVTTLGSFQSSQAIAAKQWLSETYGFGWINKSLTYVFEWMDPSNFTTIPYRGEKKLVLIGIFMNGSFPYELDKDVGYGWEGEIVKNVLMEKLSYEEIAKRIRADEEGFVLVDKLNRDMDSGQRYRIKIKGEEFLRLHRSKWGVTALKVYEWTYGLSPRTVAYDELDEETRVWVDGVKTKLASKLADLTEQGRYWAAQERSRVSHPRGVDHVFIREQVPQEHRAFVYASIAGNEERAVKNYIRMIRPRPNEYPL